MSITLEDYEAVYAEIRDVCHRFKELDPDAQERIYPKVLELKEEVRKLRQALGERLMEMSPAHRPSHMNWYTKD